MNELAEYKAFGGSSWYRLVITSVDFYPRKVYGFYQDDDIHETFESDLYGEGKETYFKWVDGNLEVNEVYLVDLDDFTENKIFDVG